MKKVISSEKKNEIYAGIICVLLFFWTIASVLGIIAFFRTEKEESAAFNVVGASADAPADLIDTVPGANYFNISAFSNQNVDWYWYSIAKTIGFKGNGTNTFQIGDTRSTSNYSMLGNLTVGDDYIITYSSYPEGSISLKIGTTVYNSGDIYTHTSGTKPIYLTGDFVSGSSFRFVECCVNKGTTAYPFSYYFYFDADTVYDLGYQAAGGDADASYEEGYTAGFNSGFNNGFNEGLSEGYEEGEQAGFDSAIGEMKAGIFARSSLQVSFAMTYSGNTTTYDVPLDSSAFIYGGINFRYLNTYIQDQLGVSTFYLAGLKVIFEEAVSWETITNLRFSTDLINSSTNENVFLTSTVQLIRDLNYPDLVMSFDLYEDNGLYRLSDVIAYPSWLIKQMNININMGTRSPGSFNFSIYDGLSSYTEGYEVGFIDGESQGNSIGYDKGYLTGQNAGYKEGYNVGKIDGIESANEYSFVGLLSAVVDVPVRAFTSLFDFNVLGINIAQFFLSLLSVAFVLVVVKLLI